MLSSLARFHRHPDEKSLDYEEGRAVYFHRTAEGGTFVCHTLFGTNAYVLSTSLRTDSELQDKFGSSYIRINETTRFAVAVSNHIPGLLAGFEGACHYVSNRSIEAEGPPIEVSKVFKADGAPDTDGLQKLIAANVQERSCFMKNRRFAVESEYRLIWLTSKPLQELLILKVPEAIQFCARPGSLVE